MEKKYWSQLHPYLAAGVLVIYPLLSVGTYTSEVLLWGMGKIVHPKKCQRKFPKIWVEVTSSATIVHIGKSQYISLDKSAS